MIGPPAIRKNMPRGRPFQKGQSGNPRGRPKRTPEEVQLIEACRAKAPEALEVIEDMMPNGESGRVRFVAARYIIDRGYGKTPERIEVLKPQEEGPLPCAERTPYEAYMNVVHGEMDIDDVEDQTLQLTEPGEEATGLEVILAEHDA